MKHALSVTVCALGAAASQALAGFTFATFSSIDAPSTQENAAFATDYGSISADLSTAVYGSVFSELDASDASLAMTSEMSILGNHPGDASGMAFYTFDAPVTVLVTWSWSNLDLTGGWSVSELGSGEPVDVASLAFSGSTFATVGGFSTTASGSGTFELAAGSYHFQSQFRAQTMPASSSVVFSFVVPAPGAFAILGAAGLVAGGTRRRA
jgi:hypothetical protein